MTEIDENAFEGCTSLTSIIIPESVTVIDKYVFSGCTSLNSVTIPDGVTEIGERAFEDCTSLTSITIPDSVTEIGWSAFLGCTGLTSVTIPDSITKICYDVFEGCIGLTSITIPDSVTIIDVSAFCGCTSLTSVTIPDSVKDIGGFAFGECTGLISISLGNGLVSIADDAFDLIADKAEFLTTNGLPNVNDNTIQEFILPNWQKFDSKLIADIFINKRSEPFVKLYADFNGDKLNEVGKAIYEQLCDNPSEIIRNAAADFVAMYQTMVDNSVLKLLHDSISDETSSSLPKQDIRRDVPAYDSSNSIKDDAEDIIVKSSNNSKKESKTKKSAQNKKNQPHSEIIFDKETKQIIIPMSVTEIDKKFSRNLNKYIWECDIESINIYGQILVFDDLWNNSNSEYYKDKYAKRFSNHVDDENQENGSYYMDEITDQYYSEEFDEDDFDEFAFEKAINEMIRKIRNIIINSIIENLFYIVEKKFNKCELFSEPQSIYLSPYHFGLPEEYAYKVLLEMKKMYPDDAKLDEFASRINNIVLQESDQDNRTGSYNRTGFDAELDKMNYESWLSAKQQKEQQRREEQQKRNEEEQKRLEEYRRKYYEETKKKYEDNCVIVRSIPAMRGKTFAANGVDDIPTLTAFIKKEGAFLREKISGKTDYLIVSVGGASDSKYNAVLEQANKGHTVEVIFFEDFAKYMDSKNGASDNSSCGNTIDEESEEDEQKHYKEKQKKKAAPSQSNNTATITSKAQDDATPTKTDEYLIVGKTAVKKCFKGAVNVIIPDGIKSISPQAFKECDKLKTVKIPDTIQSIGKNAFENCSSLVSIKIPDGANEIKEGTFSYCDSLKKVSVPDSIQSIEKDAFMNCKSLVDFHIPKGITSIPENAFAYCESLERIDIPNSVQSIEKSAFKYCKSLKSIHIPYGVTIISDFAFSGCAGLTSITIPSSVTSIGEDAFSGCSSLSNIVIPESVISIGDGAFSGCTELISINISKNVSIIGIGVFADDVKLERVDFDKLNPYYSYSDGILYNKDYTALISCLISHESVTVPEGIVNIGESAFYKSYKLKSIAFPNSLINAQKSAFEYCTKLESLYFPDSIKTIGSFAFYKCTNLSIISIPNSIESIGSLSLSLGQRVNGIIQVRSTVSITNKDIDNLNNQISKCKNAMKMPVKSEKEKARLELQVAELTVTQSKLGFFKRKQKVAIGEQINAIKNQIALLERSIITEKQEQKKIQLDEISRLEKIKAEYMKVLDEDNIRTQRVKEMIEKL